MELDSFYTFTVDLIPQAATKNRRFGNYKHPKMDSTVGVFTLSKVALSECCLSEVKMEV